MDKQSAAAVKLEDPDEAGFAIDLHNTQSQQQQQQPLINNNHKNKKLFPKKLWDLINDERYNFCLRWSDDGHLVYLNRDEFEDSYLRTSENQFHTQKAISFVRQMNMYGFRKVDDCYYENDNFKRGCEHLLKNMIRKHPNKNQSSNNNNNSNHNNISVATNELSPSYYRSLSESPPDHEEAGLNSIHYYNSQPFLNHQTSLNNNCFNMSLKPIPIMNDNSCDDFVNSAQTQLLSQQQYPSSQYADPKELIKALVSQQSPSTTHIPRDLTTNARNLANVQPESNNLSAVCALLSSLNENLYQTPAPAPTIPSPNIHRANLQFDINKLSNLQHFYQQILALQPESLVGNKTAQQQAEVLNYDTNTSNKMRSTKGLDRLAGKDEDASSTSILIRDRSVPLKQGSNLNLLDEGCKDDHHLSSGDRSEDNLNGFFGKRDIPDCDTRRRDSKLNRSFKRSVDSILDSNNNTNNSNGSPDGATVPKRIKISAVEKMRHREQLSDKQQVAYNYAKNLVTQVAQARDTRLDPDVISEASTYTQHFVEMLFDTLQVIARHSTNTKSTPDTMSSANDNSNPVDDSKNDKEVEKSSINLNDLTSALKLLPSKLSKILTSLK